MTFRKKEIIINGKKVFYWEANHTKNNVIVLLHGFPGNHTGLLDMAKNIGDYRIIIPDFPACGQSEPFDKKYNLENYSNWLNLFLQNISINKTILIGHSFGARVALVFCERFPEKVERLILLAPVVKVEGLIARAVSIEYRIAEALPDYLKKMWLLNPIHHHIGNYIVFKSKSPKKRAELIKRDLSEMRHLNPKINIELFDEFYKFSLVPVGKKIKIKSLIIAGEKDEVAPLNSVRELANQLLDNDFVVLKNGGHILVAERPITTANIIKTWLNK